jgi:deoxyribonuclease V
MEIATLHGWNLTPTEAVALQRRLAKEVDARTPLTRCDLIAGADVSHSRFSNTIYAGVVVLRMGDLSLVERQGVVTTTTFPYVPGLLSFRETPALLQAFAKVQNVPDAVMVDGHGYAHPRRCGFACHIGLWLRLPALGCAKSRLTGEFKPPGVRPGSVSPLVDHEEVIGQVVRTKKNVKPVFASVGNQIDLPTSVELILTTCRGYRIPEPTRQAHLYVNEIRRESE